MQSIRKIIHCYNQVATAYAADRVDELHKKHLDQLLLKAFIVANHHKGPLADFGCGPGQVTKFLYSNGATNVIGVDVAGAMIKVAKKISPDIMFKKGDLLNLSFNSEYFGGITAFYAIVHFTYDQIKKAFKEINRVLKNEGQFLFSYHVGDRIVHFDTVHEKKVNIDMYFFETEKILDLLTATGFNIIDAIEREPYGGVEYPSRRGYILAEKRKG